MVCTGKNDGTIINDLDLTKRILFKDKSRNLLIKNAWVQLLLVLPDQEWINKTASRNKFKNNKIFRRKKYNNKSQRKTKNRTEFKIIGKTLCKPVPASLKFISTFLDALINCLPKVLPLSIILIWKTSLSLSILIFKSKLIPISLSQ